MSLKTELTDERIYALAKECFGGLGHDLIWMSDPRYAAACEMDADARWSVSAIRAEQTLAFARKVVSSLILEREEAGGETADSSHLAVPTNGPENLSEAAGK